MTDYSGLPLVIKENARARRVLVKLVPGRGLEVVVPRGFDTGLVPDILDEKRKWIERTRDRMLADGTDLSGEPPEMPDTIEFTAMNRTYALHCVHRAGRISVTENATRLMLSGPVTDPSAVIAALQHFTARKARQFLLPRLDSMSRNLGMKYSALRVRRQKTRWGSCSGRGTISLNAKALFLPIELVDHLLLHELCHTRYLNHSKKYWALVAHHEPDFVRLEDELKNGTRHVPAWFRS